MPRIETITTFGPDIVLFLSPGEGRLYCRADTDPSSEHYQHALAHAKGAGFHHVTNCGHLTNSFLDVTYLG